MTIWHNSERSSASRRTSANALRHLPLKRSTPAVTPDGRYIVVRGRLWRRANPHLPDDERTALVTQLMNARRAVRAALASPNDPALAEARASVNAAKIGLGERGPVWWDDDADLNRHLARNTSYAEWYDTLDQQT